MDLLLFSRKNRIIMAIARADATVIKRDDCGPAPNAIGIGPMKMTRPPLVAPEETDASIISSVPAKIMMKAAMKNV